MYDRYICFRGICSYDCNGWPVVPTRMFGKFAWDHQLILMILHGVWNINIDVHVVYIIRRNANSWSTLNVRVWFMTDWACVLKSYGIAASMKRDTEYGNILQFVWQILPNKSLHVFVVFVLKVCDRNDTTTAKCQMCKYDGLFFNWETGTCQASVVRNIYIYIYIYIYW